MQNFFKSMLKIIKQSFFFCILIQLKIGYNLDIILKQSKRGLKNA